MRVHKSRVGYYSRQSAFDVSFLIRAIMKVGMTLKREIPQLLSKSASGEPQLIGWPIL